jgi:hypothetical protein
MTWYRPILRPQIGDPTTSLDASICTLESAAMALDFDTLGGVQVWGGQLVPYCGKTPAQIAAKGTRLEDAALAWTHWGRTLTIRSGERWTALESVLSTGVFLVVQGIYGALPAKYRYGSFLGPHAMAISPEPCGIGTLLVGDPLHSDWMAMPASAIWQYMKALSVTNGEGSDNLYWATSIAHFGGAVDATAVPDMTCTCKPGGSLYYDLASTQYVATSWAGGTSVGTYGTASRPKDGHVMRSVRVQVHAGAAPIECWYGNDLCVLNDPSDVKHSVVVTATVDGTSQTQKISLEV